MQEQAIRNGQAYLRYWIGICTSELSHRSFSPPNLVCLFRSLKANGQLSTLRCQQALWQHSACITCFVCPWHQHLLLCLSEADKLWDDTSEWPALVVSSRPEERKVKRNKERERKQRKHKNSNRVCTGESHKQQLTPSFEFTEAPWSHSSCMLEEQSDIAFKRKRKCKLYCWKQPSWNSKHLLGHICFTRIRVTKLKHDKGLWLSSHTITSKVHEGNQTLLFKTLHSLMRMQTIQSKSIVTY